MEQDTPTTQQTAGLARRVLKGAGWVFGTSSVSLALRLISNLIMVRYLQPDAFGLMAFAILALVAIELMTDIGIGPSVIRENDGDTERFLRVAWTVQLIRSFCIAVGILLIATGIYFIGPHIGAPGSVYGRPEAPVIIACLAIPALFKGGESTNVFLARRRLAYGRVSALELGSQGVALLFMVAAVQISPTVWVLLAGVLVGAVSRLLLSHMILHGPSMGWAYDRDVRVRLWSFGKWIMASSALNYVAVHADALILGGLLGAATFGIYTIANTWIQGGISIIRKFSDEVGYSAFSEVINKRPQDLPQVFSKYMRAMTVLVLVAFVACVSLARPFIDLLYPDDFAAAEEYLQLMAPMLLLFRGKAHMDIIVAIGNSRAVATASLIRSIAVCLFVPAGFSLAGVNGAIVGSITAQSLVLPYVYYHSRKRLSQRQMAGEWGWYFASLLSLYAIFISQQ